ncbi:MAG: DUF2461 domain-containing protein [candidate division Zixibacteria bacterium]|nr:DUF2461 domain-containing protein [candidate division Zixibacteria bacterium]
MPAFTGFPKESISFLKALKKNNDKIWFEKHKSEYEDYVQNPARDYVTAMGPYLKKLSPGIHADPRVNKSLFKVYRDIRFSKDKRPFKTNLGIWFWQGEGKRFDYSGFYFHLDPPTFMLAAGIHVFDSSRLKTYRESVVHQTHGPALVKAIRQIEKSGFKTGGHHYKKTPRGYDSDHKRAEYLLFNGLNAYQESKVPKEFFSEDLIDYSFRIFKGMSPIHKWLVKLTERTAR